MFTAIFSKTIWDADTPATSKTMVALQRKETLPFAPSTNIEMFWGYDSPQAPKRVFWDVERQRFSCSMEDEFPHEVGVDEFDFEWLIENAQTGGWSLIKRQPV